MTKAVFLRGNLKRKVMPIYWERAREIGSEFLKEFQDLAEREERKEHWNLDFVLSNGIPKGLNPFVKEGGNGDLRGTSAYASILMNEVLEGLGLDLEVASSGDIARILKTNPKSLFNPDKDKLSDRYVCGDIVLWTNGVPKGEDPRWHLHKTDKIALSEYLYEKVRDIKRVRLPIQLPLKSLSLDVFLGYQLSEMGSGEVRKTSRPEIGFVPKEDKKKLWQHHPPFYKKSSTYGTGTCKIKNLDDKTGFPKPRKYRGTRDSDFGPGNIHIYPNYNVTGVVAVKMNINSKEGGFFGTVFPKVNCFSGPLFSEERDKYFTNRRNRIVLVEKE